MESHIELARRQRVLSEFGDFVLDHEGLDEILNEGCRLIAEALNADLAKVIEIERNGGTGFVRAGVGWNPGIVGHERVSLTERSSEAYAVKMTGPVITNDITREKRFAFPRFLLDHGVIALINVPILLPGRRPWGVLQVDSRKVRAFDRGDIEFLKTYAMALGPVIDRLRVAAEREDARRGMVEREQQLRTVLEGIGDRFYVLDRDWRVQFASRSALIAWGKEQEDVLGRVFLEAFPDAGGSEAFKAHQRVMAGGAAETFETVSPVLNRWIECSITPASEGGLSVAFRDIDDRKRAEARLLEREENQAFLLVFSDALRPLADAATIIITASRLLGEHIGAKRIAYAEVGKDDVMTVLPGWQTQGVAALGGRRFSLSDFGVDLAAMLKAGGTHVLRDSQTDPEMDEELRAAYAAVQIGAAIGVPLVKDGRLLAIMAAHDLGPREWTGPEILVVEQVAERTWAAVERAHVETALRHREADLAHVQRVGQVGGIDIDVADGLTSRRSPEYLRIHGLPDGARIESHKDWLMRVHPEDRGRAEQTLFASLSDGASIYENEYRIIRPSDGVVRWIYARADIERDSDGKAIRLVGAHLDVTEQKRLQASIRESEERLQKFGEASQGILWIRDSKTMAWTYLTPAFEEIYGLSRDEALRGDNYRNWLELIVPEDREHARGMIDRVLAGESLTFEYRIRRPKDGDIRWLRDTDFPIRNGPGQIFSFGGIGQDVTALKISEEKLKTSEERLRSAAEVARFALWDWNILTGDLAWSDEHFRMEGYAVGEVAPSYEAWAARIHPDDRAETEAALLRARNTHTEYVHEFRSLHPDGSVHWLSGRGRFYYDDTGAPVRMIGAMLETTERREWEERQKVLVAELQHRTRNLMGIVRSISDKTARASADIVDFRARFRDRLEALSRVQGLLSRLKEHDRVTFDELIQTELSAMDGNSDRVTIDGPSGIRLRSSTVQTLAMAIHELATNAVKYGALGQPDGRLHIRWSFERVGLDGKPWLHVDWYETGVRMPAVGSGPQGSGQGRELIEKALPFQLKAKTTFQLGSEGIRCTLSVPVSAKPSADSALF